MLKTTESLRPGRVQHDQKGNITAVEISLDYPAIGKLRTNGRGILPESAIRRTGNQATEVSQKIINSLRRGASISELSSAVPNNLLLGFV